MTGQRLNEKGELLTAAEPKPHPVDWLLAKEVTGTGVTDVVVCTHKFVPKWSHQYLITGVLSGYGLLHVAHKMRTAYVKVNGSTLYRTQTGSIHDGGPNDAAAYVAVPILALWTAPDENEVTITVGVLREGGAVDDGWALGGLVHNVHIVDVGSLV